MSLHTHGIGREWDIFMMLLDKCYHCQPQQLSRCLKMAIDWLFHTNSSIYPKAQSQYVGESLLAFSLFQSDNHGKLLLFDIQGRVTPASMSVAYYPEWAWFDLFQWLQETCLGPPLPSPPVWFCEFTSKCATERVNSVWGSGFFLVSLPQSGHSAKETSHCRWQMKNYLHHIWHW